MAAPTKTTVGRLMIYNSLPKPMRDSRILTDPNFVLDGKTVNSLLSTVAKDHHADFGKVADRFKDMGNANATGASFSLNDFVSDYRHRDRVLAAASKEEHKILNNHRLSLDAKEDKVVALYGKASEEISKKAKAKADASDNKMYDWVRSGARGNWDQFRQITVAPILVADHKNRAIPIPIGKSYSEGLDIGSYWASMHGARMGTISKVQGTWRPGLASKQLMQATMNQLITKEDCGTNKGVRFPSESRNILNRFTVGDINLGTRGGKKKGTIPSGTMVTPDVMSRLKNNKVQEVVVRSPLKCTIGKGLCSKCYGLNQDGKLHPEGTNIGVIAAHSLGEPSTQLSMKVFHTGGIVGAKETGASSMFDRLDQLINIPKTLPGAATIAHVDGEVEKVQKDPAAGGWNVLVEGQRHYIPGSLELLAKRGMKVKKGQSLSSGPKNPRELLPLVGMNYVQSYLVNELQDAYENEVPISRRNTETFVRSLTNLSEVTDSGDHPNYLRGDSVPTSEIKEFNRKKGTEVEGRVKHRPVLTGVKMLPLEMQEDWLARLQSTNLKKTIVDAASEGWRSMLHSTHPIPGMAYGKEFGKGTEEQPWLY
jgi:DNA-directed RNA polymerase subunit beta'